MLGMASVPPEDLPARQPTGDPNAAAAAAAVAETPMAIHRDELPAPHRARDRAEVAVALVGPYDLRKLVGRRDRRPSAEVAFGWARALHLLPGFEGLNGTALLAWAEQTHRLHTPDASSIQIGDLLVFGRVEGKPHDLVAIVTGRLDRGVFEIVYVGGGVIRRGFVDPSRPRVHRDNTGAVVNTFLRHGKRQPPKGTKYLTGELLESVVRAGTVVETSSVSDRRD